MEQPFQVGSIYRNHIGAYKVLRFGPEPEKMLVRYLATGEEDELTIALQERIWRNMGWDEQEKARQQAVEEARYQHGYGEDFAGLRETDFKSNTEGTTWRSRRGLAGQVSRLLSQASTEHAYTFVSWDIYRWPVAFLTHREDYNMAAFEMGVRKAKFTIELDAANAYYGFYVERGDTSVTVDATWDWTRLRKGFQEQPSLLQSITELEASRDVRFLGRGCRIGDTFHFSNGLERGAYALWDEEEPWRLTVAERVRCLAERPEDEWVEMYLVGAIPKAEAITAGVHVAHTMAQTMKALLPIYTAAIRG
jgi:hypothetical protein